MGNMIKESIEKLLFRAKLNRCKTELERLSTEDLVGIFREGYQIAKELKMLGIDSEKDFMSAPEALYERLVAFKILRERRGADYALKLYEMASQDDVKDNARYSSTQYRSIIN